MQTGIIAKVTYRNKLEGESIKEVFGALATLEWR